MKPQIARADVGTAAEKSGRDPGEKKLFVSRTTGYVKVSAEQITNFSPRRSLAVIYRLRHETHGRVDFLKSAFADIHTERLKNHGI